MRVFVSEAKGKLTELVKRAERVRGAAVAKVLPGLVAARSQDFLFGCEGMPE